MTKPKFIPVSEPNISGKEIAYVNKALKSGWISSSGFFVDKFEKEFARYSKRKHAIAVSNGTVALHLALLALGIKPGDEVIIPNFAFVAVANAVIYMGAKPVLADIESDTFNINPESIKKVITKKTKAIIVVHTYGHPCDMDAILAIAKQHHLKIIEDAAEAHGAIYKGKPCGSFGDISCFSFYGNKTMTTGEGGMVLTNNKAYYQTMTVLKSHGMSPTKKYWHNVVGYNYRLTNIQAALGCAQLESLKKFITIKRANARLYKNFLKDVSWIILPQEKDYAKNSYWLFSILIKPGAGITRDKLMSHLKKHGIDSRVFFYPISHMPPYKKYRKGNLEVSETIAYRGLSLPFSTKLTSKEIEYICAVIKKI